LVSDVPSMLSDKQNPPFRPLPIEKLGPSVANIIGRFEQQTKKQGSLSPGPRTSSVVSHITGDSTKEEIKERREWPPRDSGDTGGKIIESAEASRGMCHYHDGVGSLVMSTSFEEGPEGHDARRFHG